MYLKMEKSLHIEKKYFNNLKVVQYCGFRRLSFY